MLRFLCGLCGFFVTATFGGLILNQVVMGVRELDSPATWLFGLLVLGSMVCCCEYMSAAVQTMHEKRGGW